MDKKEIEYKASELSKEYAITTHNDGYDVTEYPDVTMLYKMAEWMREQLGWQCVAERKYPSPGWGDADYVALCKNDKLRLFTGICDVNYNGEVLEYFYWNDDREEPVDFDDVIAWIELPSFNK